MPLERADARGGDVVLAVLEGESPPENPGAFCGAQRFVRDGVEAAAADTGGGGVEEVSGERQGAESSRRQAHGKLRLPAQGLRLALGPPTPARGCV